MRDFRRELNTLKAERKRVDGIAHSSDAIALACFKRGECFAEKYPFEYSEFVKAELMLELIDNEIEVLKREASNFVK